ncbi:MAG: hypothetical protein C0609_10675 [Deltaproteobacteria bacterium]|nr:MAG: hypothetical protein C0609_10675 [Deltaproteobacteria bacterium]
MKSKIADAISLETQPVAQLWEDERPDDATVFKPGKWGCIMWLMAAAAKGRTAACDRETFGCFGGGVGVGFGEQYLNFPGGEECFTRFLSSGNASSEKGRAVAEAVKPYMTEETHEEFLEGERYLKDPERARAFIDQLPITDIPARWVVFKPLSAILEGAEPQVVTFFARPHQLAALIVLANYDAPTVENVISPFAAGCQAAGIIAYREAAANSPRAVMGLIDISARLQVKKSLGDDIFSISLPWKLFMRMESNVEESFLMRPTWRALIS